MSVTILEGQLARTWKYTHNQRQHLINLYHDTITGVRSAMLNYEEIFGSVGNSSVLMERPHYIQFDVDMGVTGLITIHKDGFFGFQYECVVNGVPLVETSQEAVTSYEEVFRADVTDTFTTPDEDNGSTVAWYIVETTRLKDNTKTRVHRRFRDFADMNSQVKQNLKGHILFGSIPSLPEKTLKILVDHNDEQFIQDRVQGLKTYLSLLVSMPQICDMTCVKGFVGIMEQVREFSITFDVATLGFSLQNPVTVDAIQRPELCPGLDEGDSISKINGVPVAGLSFNGVVSRLKFLPRPMIVHFVRVLGKEESASTGAAAVGDEAQGGEKALPKFVDNESI